MCSASLNAVVCVQGVPDWSCGSGASRTVVVLLCLSSSRPHFPITKMADGALPVLGYLTSGRHRK